MPRRDVVSHEWSPEDESLNFAAMSDHEIKEYLKKSGANLK